MSLRGLFLYLSLFNETCLISKVLCSVQCEDAVYSEMERMWKEAVVACFITILNHGVYLIQRKHVSITK